MLLIMLWAWQIRKCQRSRQINSAFQSRFNSFATSSFFLILIPICYLSLVCIEIVNSLRRYRLLVFKSTLQKAQIQHPERQSWLFHWILLFNISILGILKYLGVLVVCLWWSFQYWKDLVLILAKRNTSA